VEWRETTISRKRGLMSTKSRDDIINFFESLKARRFSDAEKALQAINEKRFGDTDFKKGYINALEGLLLSHRTGDERDFLQRAPFDKKSMRGYSKDFKEFVKNGYRSPFDVGYFLAWSDMLQYRMSTEN
jgi:hypothetical protein